MSSELVFPFVESGHMGGAGHLHMDEDGIVRGSVKGNTQILIPSRRKTLARHVCMVYGIPDCMIKSGSIFGVRFRSVYKELHTDRETGC